eukprot:TRINITY_DN22088_c0_g1_i1.p1 TRINITY_DN22088_c0_g1~~TRINITY_DN22088_c0_g1_i1.p1  ORF type:complete len:104 (-),score=2.23 TRINITY_DN22088_c0_g1_i1:482-793(-)
MVDFTLDNWILFVASKLILNLQRRGWRGLNAMVTRLLSETEGWLQAISWLKNKFFLGCNLYTDIRVEDSILAITRMFVSEGILCVKPADHKVYLPKHPVNYTF